MSAPIVHVTGARPNFPKAAPVIRALASRGVEQVLVHTGQHYDDRMSEVFFQQLQLPRPDVNLGVGSGTHAAQTAAIMTGLEALFLERRPALVVVYGDVNSTVAAALVAAKLLVPVAHVEAGLRSFDMTMPEEVNRRLTDQLSDLLFVTSVDAVGHLGREGIDGSRVHFVGNPMIDTLFEHLDKFDVGRARAARGLPESYGVVTLHRPSNVDDPNKASEVVKVLAEVADHLALLLPLHPRGRAVLEAAGLNRTDIRVTEPLPYVEFMSLVRGARCAITDSGGVQEETTALGVPCLTVRPNTERPVTITHGTNRLVELEGLIDAVAAILVGSDPVKRVATMPPLWDGAAGARIASIVAGWPAPRF